VIAGSTRSILIQFGFSGIGMAVVSVCAGDQTGTHWGCMKLMKGKTIRKHSLFGKITASLFLSCLSAVMKEPGQCELCMMNS